MSRRIGAFLGLSSAVVGVVAVRGTFEDPQPRATSLGSPAAQQPAPKPAPTRYVTAPPIITHVPAGGTVPRSVVTEVAHPPAQVRAVTGRRVLLGETATNKYGPVQVSVTLEGNRIVEVTPLKLPDESARDRSINEDAIPRLRRQVLDAQGAAIDGVSGATYTSQSYALSVQSALDKA